MMAYKAVFHVLISLISLLTSSNGQWTPDPFCPYPSYDPTRYPYFGNCSVYWECFEGTKYVMECPTGLEFNAPLQECDDPEIAQCNPLATTTKNPNPPTGYTTSGTTGYGPDPQCPYPSEVETYLPYPGDCTKFYMCFEGIKYTYDCPEGLWWHEAISECDLPGDFCGDTNTTQTQNPNNPTSSSTTWSPDSQCPYPSDEETFLPYPGDCTKFYMCFGGNRYTFDCPEGLWWYEAIQECDQPGDFCPSNSTITPPTKPTTGPTIGPDDPTCPFPSEEEVYFPYPGDCTKFIMCFEGNKYVYSCPEGLWWHEAISTCDEPGDFCGENPTTKPTTSTPNDLDPRCSDGSISYWPQPDCHKYIECFNFDSYEIVCPPKLYYSANQGVCVDADESECCSDNPASCSS